MRIVVDVNHPKDVQLFKNFILDMKKKGHEILITATEKDITLKLLDIYGFDYINLGSYGKSLIQKLLNIPIIDIKMYNSVRRFNPDIFLGLGSIRAAHVSYLLHKKCIIFEDTEHSTEQIMLYMHFVNAVFTPTCFKKDLGKKQVRFNGYIELAYLHKSRFTPNVDVLRELDIGEGESFIVLRFVSWNASHDIGQHGIKNKIKFVEQLGKYGRVLITSEDDLAPELEKYKIRISPEKIHDLLYYATLYIGEGASMATESAILGTPSIYISSLVNTMGNFDELVQKYSLVYIYENSDEALNKALELIQKPEIKKEWRKKRENLLNDKIDVTKFMIKLIENY